jgi:hypothetical protein
MVISRRCRPSADVVDRWRAGIARGDGDHLDGADGAVVDLRTAAKCGSKRLCPTISVALALSTTARHFSTRLIESISFAEDRLAGLGEAFDQIGMGVGRRADDDGVDVPDFNDDSTGAIGRASSVAAFSNASATATSFASDWSRRRGVDLAGGRHRGGRSEQSWVFLRGWFERGAR